MVKFAVGIVHTSWDAKRRASVAEIKRRLSGDARLETVIVQDDYDRRGCGPNTVRLWRKMLAQTKAPYVIPIADDMIPCGGFFDACEKLVALLPDNPIGLFSMREKTQAKAMAGGSRWYCTYDNWGSSTMYPRQLLQNIVDWNRQFQKPNLPWEDTITTSYCMATKTDVYVCNPSLLQHSLAGNSVAMLSNNPGRISATYMDPVPEDIDWERGVGCPLRVSTNLVKPKDYEESLR